MTDPNENHDPVAEIGPRIMAAVFGITFGGIGLSVMGFMWGQEPGFGDPPVFFKVFATLIAIPFVAFGAMALYGAFTGKGMNPGSQLEALQKRFGKDREIGSDPPDASPQYTCPNCSAPLSGRDEVSPHGDVKCSHCNAWFNVHGK
jgi:hypothetical protein